jgi:thiazole/oxazole-forming peptide maturase SagC family component
VPVKGEVFMQIDEKVKAFPVKLIYDKGAVFIVRGCQEIRITGDFASEIVSSIINFASEKPVAIKDIINQFAAPDRDAIHNLIKHLIEKSILVPENATQEINTQPENSLDIFYWHFNESATNVIEKYQRNRIALIGVNSITRQLAVTLSESGASNFAIVDDPFLRNEEMFRNNEPIRDKWPFDTPAPLTIEQWSNEDKDLQFDCMAVSSDFGFTPMISKWNSLCVSNNRKMIPLVLDRMVGYVGPLIVPGETACYECLRARENSNMDDYSLKRRTENVSFECQKIRGRHPAMASIIGNMAAMELTSFYSGIKQVKVGYMVEIKMLEPDMQMRKVLKLPRCPVCSPFKNHSAVNLDKACFPHESLSKSAFSKT